MSLESWLRNGWLLSHRSSASEVQSLLALADRDLADAEVQGLSADWKFSIAYNGALQSATAALAAAGYRASREAHHYRVLQSLEYTIGAELTLRRLLDHARKKRNIGGYEQAGAVTDGEALEMVQTARELRHRVEEWLRSKHPDLFA